MEPEEPLFSVIMPVHDHAEFVEAAVRSVLGQTFPSWELIVVDDGSTDGSRELVGALLAAEPRARVRHQANLGPAAARNRAAAGARAPWLAFLDSDDLWYPGTLERYAACIRAHPGESFLHGSRDRLGPGGEVERLAGRHQDRPTGVPELFAEMHLSTLSVACRRELFLEARGFDESLRNGEDYDLFLRLGLRSPLFPAGFSTGLRRRHDRNTSRASGPGRLAEARVLERFAALPEARAVLSPALVARRLGRVFRSAGRRCLREGRLADAEEAFSRALRHDRSTASRAWLWAWRLRAPRTALRALRLERKARRTSKACGPVVSGPVENGPAEGGPGRSGRLAQIVEEALRSGPFRPQQRQGEVLRLLEVLRALSPRRVLEIGSWRGGTFLLFSRAAHPRAQLIALDRRFPVERRIACRRLVLPTQEAACLEADSRSAEAMDRVKFLLRGEPLDFLFIDGDHSLEGVSEDFRLYAPLVRPGGLVALHDIVPSSPERSGDPHAPASGGVPDFWREIRAVHRTEELIEDPRQEGYGIGLVWTEAPPQAEPPSAGGSRLAARGEDG